MHLSFPVLVLERILFVSYFISMGTSHLLNIGEHSALLKRKGVPLPRAATVLTVVMMVSSGIFVLVDWRGWIGSALLFGIIFPAPFFLHRFWNETDSYMQLSELAHMMKDLSLASAATLCSLSTDDWVPFWSKSREM